MSYPEHEKLKAISEQSNACGRFHDWLQEKGYVLAEYASRNTLYPAQVRLTALLAEFFEIDEAKIEEEKREMLRELQAMSAAGGG